MVTIPQVWYSEQAKELIDQEAGEGTYASFSFNANNPQRMSIAWTAKDVESIMSKCITDYNKLMMLYTLGTGGGRGDAVAYSVWNAREELQIGTYASKQNTCSKVWLTIVHLWDKYYSWPFTVMKGNVPPGTGVDEGGTGDNAGPTAVYTTPPRGGSGISKVATETRALMDAMAANSTKNNEAMANMTSQFLEGLNTQLHPEGVHGAAKSQTEKQIEIQQAIEYTSSQLQLFSDKKERLGQEKRKLKEEELESRGSSPGRVQRYKKLKMNLKQTDNLIEEYEDTLDSHIAVLAKVNAKGRSQANGSSNVEAGVDNDSDNDSVFSDLSS